ncbi:SDR family NAD(P)-dependent oxidoreductase [Saccharospirillum sp. HFRX-1]|uniref:SDR family oxidoreductase n=1 Tax=unclassified Saccharospirillum TaxID=2633430 RepID=UPI003714E42E
MNLQGQTALVTGGSAGIGQALALMLAEQGAEVIIVGRDEQRLRETAAQYPQRIHYRVVDLTQPEQQDWLVAEVKQEWPQLSLLINNAGVQINMPPIGVDDAGLLEAMRAEQGLNLAAPITLCFGLLPTLAQQPEASIVNVSSGLALAPKRTAPVYCATKAGLSQFSRALRYRCEDAAPSVAVMDVMMALVDTQMTAGRGRGKLTPEQAAQAIIDAIEQRQPQLWVANTKLLRVLLRCWPPLAYKLLRNG